MVNSSEFIYVCMSKMWVSLVDKTTFSHGEPITDEKNGLGTFEQIPVDTRSWGVCSVAGYAVVCYYVCMHLDHVCRGVSELYLVCLHPG